MKSALIYDCLTIKKISLKLPVKLKNLELLVFKCAHEQAQKSKIILEDLKIKKIDVATIKADRELAFLKAMAKSSRISLGEKSSLALAYCGQNGVLLVAADPCVIDVAGILDIPNLQI